MWCKSDICPRWRAEGDISLHHIWGWYKLYKSHQVEVWDITFITLQISTSCHGNMIVAVYATAVTVSTSSFPLCCCMHCMQCVCVHTCVCMYVCMYVCTCVCVRAHACVCVCVCVCVCCCVYMCMNVYACLRMCVCMCRGEGPTLGRARRGTVCEF